MPRAGPGERVAAEGRHGHAQSSDQRVIAEAARVPSAALRRYLADGMSDRAPGLAYYGILSLFPLLLIGTAAIRLLAGSDGPGDLAAFARREGASGAVADA